MPKSRTRYPLTLKLASSLTMADPQISAIAVGTVAIESIKRPANSRMLSKIRMFINVYLDFISKLYQHTRRARPPLAARDAQVIKILRTRQSKHVLSHPEPRVKAVPHGIRE